ncbi:unnamed protein product, partial [Candidula unifasciata]
PSEGISHARHRDVEQDMAGVNLQSGFFRMLPTDHILKISHSRPLLLPTQESNSIARECLNITILD